MTSNLNNKSNEQKNYNFVYSPVNMSNKISMKKDNPENPKIISSNEQLTKYYFQNLSLQNKNQNKNSSNSQSVKDKQKINSSPNNQFFYKSKMQKEANASHSKNFNDTKSSEHNNRSPISLTGRITNLHNIKTNKEKVEEEKRKHKGSNINLNFTKNQIGKIDSNILIKSSNLIGHNSKSVNSNNNVNKNIKIGNNLIIKTVNEGVNNLRKENIYGKKSNYNFSNNNHGIINNMNNNTSKNKKKNEVSNSSNLNLGMLSFSTSNISSVNNLIPVSNNLNNNMNNEINNNSNNLNNNKNSNVTQINTAKDDQNKNNLNLCLDYISNTNAENNNDKNNVKLITNADNNANKNKNIQTKSAEQTTRNPKYFNNESIYNTNYIFNFIDSNEDKNGKAVENNKPNNNSNQIYLIGQKEIKNNNNNAYKELTNITKTNVNEILSKKNVKTQNFFEGSKKEDKKNSENYSGNSFIKKYFEISDGQRYKNPEELHFSMVRINQNINRLKGKF